MTLVNLVLLHHFIFSIECFINGLLSFFLFFLIPFLLDFVIIARLDQWIFIYPPLLLANSEKACNL